MELEIGKTYTFRYRSGQEEVGKVLDVLSHPDTDPIYKVEFGGSGPTQVRLVSSRRLRGVVVPAQVEEPLEVLVPTAALTAPAPTWWERLKDLFQRNA